jgi:hypothetical protein
MTRTRFLRATKYHPRLRRRYFSATAVNSRVLVSPKLSDEIDFASERNAGQYQLVSL